jgi:acyl-CoA thioesterase-1
VCFAISREADVSNWFSFPRDAANKRLSFSGYRRADAVATLPDAPGNGKVATNPRQDDNMNSIQRRRISRVRFVLCLAAGLFSAAGCGLTGTAHAQIVALGASNVAGRGVSSSEAFPAQLERMLAGKGYNVHVANAGVNGNTNAEILARMDQAVPAGTKIVLLGTIGGTYNARRLGQGDQKADFASIMAKLRSRGIKIIPVTAAGVTRKYLQADGVHLTAEGHAVVAARLFPSVIQALGH